MLSVLTDKGVAIVVAATLVIGFALILLLGITLATSDESTQGSSANPSGTEQNRNELRRLEGEQVRSCRLRISGAYPSLSYNEVARICTITD